MDWWGLSEYTADNVVHLLAHNPRITITSGRRTPERNRAVGGVPRSKHLTGRAVDVVGDRASLEHTARHARAPIGTPGGAGATEVLMESDHLHLGW
jgi:uncharacterized protein YcbK (DUF882 family)